MSAVTICAQLGSRGQEIASGVADVLGWRVVHRDLVNEAARRIGAPEVALAEIDEFGLLGLRLRSDIRRAYVRQAETVAREIAARSHVVFLCWAGYRILDQVPDVLHVRVVASYERRLRYLMAREHISEECAAARLATSDEARSRRLQRDYGGDWRDWGAYHLIINSDRVSVLTAVSLIVQAVYDACAETEPVPV